MIQRKQSLYLLLGALLLIAMLFLDVLLENESLETLGWFSPSLRILGLLTAVVALAAIFLYGRRDRQQKVVLVAQVLTLLLMIVVYGALYLSGTYEQLLQRQYGWDEIAFLLTPVIAYVLFYFARRSIQADIALVRSMDRLR